MNASHCSPYPHYAWLAHWLDLRPPQIFDAYFSRHVTHRLLLTTHGDAHVVWATNGSETAFHTAVGNIGFFPCDHEMHALSITTADGFRAYSLFIPAEQLCVDFNSEGLPPAADFHAIPVFRDALMAASLLRLSSQSEGSQVSEGIGDEVAARHIIMRLCVAAGGRQPDWRKDTSVFTAFAMRQIVERMDSMLGSHVSLDEMARDAGLSPGHFARKFQQSMGLSLDRFINKRRIGMSLTMLREGSVPLARIALDLGFSSQSHFTRLFSRLTGMTPQRFRRLHRKMDA